MPRKSKAIATVPNESEPPSYTPLLLTFGDVTIIKKAVSANDHLMFKEKAQTPKATGATKKAVGLENAQRWLIEQVYSIEDRAVTFDWIEENLDGFQAMDLLQQALVIEGDVICLDEATAIEDTKKFRLSIDDRVVTRLPFPAREVFKFQRLIVKNSVECYRWFIKNFYQLDSKPIDDKLLEDSPIGGGLGADLCMIICRQIDLLAMGKSAIRRTS